MRAEEFLNEALTSVGAKYQDLYTQYYKRAHLAARKKGLDGQAADDYASRALDAYKSRVQSGEWDPITRTKGQGRAEYKVSEAVDYRDMDISQRDALLKQTVQQVYNQHKNEIEKRFENGNATCTYASAVVAKALWNKKISCQVISGDFDGNAHWWVQTNNDPKYVIDIGDNISSEPMKTGNVPMKIIPLKSAANYHAEEVMSPRDYLAHYPSISGY